MGLINNPQMYVPWKAYLAKSLFQQQTGHSKQTLCAVANHSLSVRQQSIDFYVNINDFLQWGV